VAKNQFLTDLRVCVNDRSWEKLGVGFFSTKVPRHIDDMRVCLQRFNGQNAAAIYPQMMFIIEQTTNSSTFRDARTTKFYSVLQQITALQSGLEHGDSRVLKEYDLAEKFRTELQKPTVDMAVRHIDIQDPLDDTVAASPISFKMPSG
jgi:hypothetical protein